MLRVWHEAEQVLEESDVRFWHLANIGTLLIHVRFRVRKLPPNSQFLYGSDEPFSSTVDMAASLNKLGFSSNDLQAIQRDNALRLFPRFQT